jgi:hypothetical protein
VAAAAVISVHFSLAAAFRAEAVSLSLALASVVFTLFHETSPFTLFTLF